MTSTTPPPLPLGNTLAALFRALGTTAGFQGGGVETGAMATQTAYQPVPV